MLVLARKIGETIVIDENIEVCIMETSNGVVKLGISAPKNVKILRKELINEVKMQNQESILNVESLIKKIK